MRLLRWSLAAPNRILHRLGARGSFDHRDLGRTMNTVGALSLILINDSGNGERDARALDERLMPQHADGPLLPWLRAALAFGQVLSDLSRMRPILAEHLAGDSRDSPLVVELLDKLHPITLRIAVHEGGPSIDAHDRHDASAL